MKRENKLAVTFIELFNDYCLKENIPVRAEFAIGVLSVKLPQYKWTIPVDIRVETGESRFYLTLKPGTPLSIDIVSSPDGLASARRRLVCQLVAVGDWQHARLLEGATIEFTSRSASTPVFKVPKAIQRPVQRPQKPGV